MTHKCALFLDFIRDDFLKTNSRSHPTGMFGSLAGALFTAYAIEGVPVVVWGRRLVEDILPRAYKYLQEKKRDWDEYQQDLRYFEKAWRDYLALRNLLYATPTTKPVFPDKYGVAERDHLYAFLAAESIIPCAAVCTDGALSL